VFGAGSALMAPKQILIAQNGRSRKPARTSKKEDPAGASGAHSGLDGNLKFARD
jgi:hypothetical protein